MTWGSLHTPTSTTHLLFELAVDPDTFELLLVLQFINPDGKELIEQLFLLPGLVHHEDFFQCTVKVTLDRTSRCVAIPVQWDGGLRG